jgi:hypothetical protein
MRRRTFFGMVGAGAAAVALPGVLPSTGRSESATAPPTARADGPSLDFLLAPVAGRALSGGFRVAAIAPIDRGAATITLRARDGAEHVVQAFRRSPLAQSEGIASTRWLDLRWMNGADGAHTTPEAGGLAVMSLASRIRRIENAAARAGLTPEQRASLRALQTIDRRNAVHGAYDVASAERA